MKKGFTIVEVSILFVIFLIVAFLVAPFSIDDTMQAKNTSRWRSVQQDFINILSSVNNTNEADSLNFNKEFVQVIDNQFSNVVKYYKINYLNGNYPEPDYNFDNYRLTNSKAIISYKMFDTPKDGIYGLLMYDVNGQNKPNVWGKDVFGFNVYPDRLEAFCMHDTLNTQRQDCSKRGTGLCCSNYYLIGGNFE